MPRFSLSRGKGFLDHHDIFLPKMESKRCDAIQGPQNTYGLELLRIKAVIIIVKHISLTLKYVFLFFILES